MNDDLFLVEKKTYTETMFFVLMQNMIIGLVDYLLVKNCPNKCWKTENCTECRGGLGNLNWKTMMFIPKCIYI